MKERLKTSLMTYTLFDFDFLFMRKWPFSKKVVLFCRSCAGKGKNFTRSFAWKGRTQVVVVEGKEELCSQFYWEMEEFFPFPGQLRPV